MLYFERQGIRIPRLGYGTWKLSGAECVEGVKAAITAGYRHIDTAQAYDNEEEVGEAIAKSGVSRHELFVVTKIWRDHMRRGDLEASVQASLKKLRMGYVDLLLIHWPVPDVPLEESLRALDALRQSGMTRLIGLSNFTVPLMQQAEAILPGLITCNQVEYHPFLSQAPVLEWVRAHNMLLTAYSPLARGKLSQSPEVRAMAEKYGRSASQISLRWLMQQDNVAAIPKAASREHMQSNLTVFDFALDAGDVQRLDNLARPDGRLINPAWSPVWDAA